MVQIPHILLTSPNQLVSHIMERLQANGFKYNLSTRYASPPRSSPAVLFMLGQYRMEGRQIAEPCLIFCERSARVRQPGDLCFPGGGVMPRLDAFSAHLLRMPGTPLSKWPHWSWWWRHNRPAARRMALFFATGLRESFEEMRVNPLGLRLLGPLMPESLALFHQTIFPIACWLHRKQRFSLNNEVSQVIPLALRDFFNPAHFACLRIKNESGSGVLERDFMCFLPPMANGSAPLWGATFRMVLSFLNTIFDFHPPSLATLPIIRGLLRRTYTTGGNPNASHGNGLSLGA